MTGMALLDEPKILVVDDEATQRLLTRSHLEGEGFTVAEASSGEEALEANLRLRPDLILLDIELPGIDGYEVIGALKSRPETATLSVIAVTSHAMVGDRERILKAGFNGYIEKPIDPDTFVEEMKVSIPDV